MKIIVGLYVGIEKEGRMDEIVGQIEYGPRSSLA